MKKRLHDKKAGVALLLVLIIISLAEVIFRATAMGLETVLTTANLGEQLAVIALAVTILILTAKGKDRACYILYGAWIGYFVLDQLFELPGTFFSGLGLLAAGTGELYLITMASGWALRLLGMIGVIVIGIFLAEYMCDGTIYNRAFNILAVVTCVMILGNVIIPTMVAIQVGQIAALLDTFNSLYRLTMVFLFTFFAYDSAKHQLKKTNLTK